MPDQGVDLVFANLLLPWIDDLPLCLEEISRVLKRGGLLVFSTLGPDSLGVLRDAWQGSDELPHVREFADMHDIGDALVRARLADPVLDVDRLSISFTEINNLYRDLTANGARNCLAGRRRGLTGRQRFKAVEERLTDASGSLTVELELVFGHAWGTGAPRGGEFRIDAGQIGRPSSRARRA